jgi:Trypsin-like peptidase domain
LGAALPAHRRSHDRTEGALLGGHHMRVPENLLEIVVFLGIKDDEKGFQPRGTGFVAGVETHGDRTCVVTAQHLVSGIQNKNKDIWLRTNLKRGGVKERRTDPDKWIFAHNPGSPPTDVALYPLAFSQEEEDVAAIRLDGARSVVATPDVFSQQDLGIGDEVIIVGLFGKHYGHNRNIPIVRVGNISMLRGETRIKTLYGDGEIEGHLIEARSISGLSGSPVFICNPFMKIREGRVIQTSETAASLRAQRFYLLGLIHGHFDVKLNDMFVEDEGDALVNTGIGIVVPAEKIVEAFSQVVWSEDS